MIKVGCAGFAIPQTRYFREFRLLEVQDSLNGPIGPGTIRRWQREAPSGFEFTLLAPREIAADGYRDTRAARSALAALESIAEVLGTEIVLFQAPADFAPSRARRQALKTFLTRFGRNGRRAAFEPPPDWPTRELLAVCDEGAALPAYDPLGPHGEDLASVADVYFRLPGPAGRRSRYEEPALERLRDACGGRNLVYCLFANVDMHSDAKRLIQMVAPLGGPAVVGEQRA